MSCSSHGTALPQRRPLYRPEPTTSLQWVARVVTMLISATCPPLEPRLLGLLVSVCLQDVVAPLLPADSRVILLGEVPPCTVDGAVAVCVSSQLHGLSLLGD